MKNQKTPPLICMDIGNTSTTYGFYQKGRLKGVERVASNNFPKFGNNLFKKFSVIPNVNIIISCVVPEINHKIKKIAKNRRIQKIWIIGENLPIKIKHNYININKLGKDRLVNAYGAVKIYGAPALILDFGTALTCDYVSEKGVFLGGLIIPGPEISLKALSDKAALLPQIPFPKNCRSLIGRDTKEGMKAGILQGYGAMTDGLIERFRKRFGRKFRVIATGGLSPVLFSYTSKIGILDPLLTLKSLAEVFKDKISVT